MLSYVADIYPIYESLAGCMIDRNWPLNDANFMCDPRGGRDFPDHYHARKTYYRLSTTNPNLRMPPGGPYLSDEQLALYRQWMDEGFNP